MTCEITDPGHPEWDAPNSGYCTSGGGCSEDTDGNGAVNVNDLLNVLSDFGSSSPQNGGDVNADGLINVTDLLQVLSRFGARLDVFDGVDNDALMIDDCNGARLCLSRCLPVSLLHAPSVGLAERSVGTEKPDQGAGRDRACVEGAR
jgi:hypothetical protein